MMLLRAFGLALVLAAPATAQVFDPFRLASLEATGTLEALEDAIVEVERAPEPDLRLLFDLAALRIEKLLAEGSSLAAARAMTDLAIYASRHRTTLEEDPLPLLRRAQKVFDEIGQDGPAAEVGARVISELKENAASEETIVLALRDQAARLRQSNDADQAETLEAEASALEQQGSSETRNLSGEGGYRLVDVFYATDRARSGEDDPSTYYGFERGPLETGIAQVSIPDAHRPGAIEAPSIWRLEFGPTPAKHVVLRSVTPVASGAFFERLSDEVEGRERKELFVFIHGYNVTFAQAAKRAAQMAYDMNFAGVPVVYSWPSKGSMTAYISDSAVVRVSGRRLMGFLEDLGREAGGATIHIVAHSMGNRALTDALELIGTKGADTPPFDQVVFAAPDVDTDLFLEMLPTIRPLAERLTLYASNEDWALAASRRLHGDVPRAGQAGEALINVSEIDAIDMSTLGEDMLAHSYFAQDASALVDLSTLFWRSVAPDRRCGIEAEDSSNWRLVGDVCRDARVLATVTALRAANVQSLAEARQITMRYIEDQALANEILLFIREIIRE